MAEIRVFVLLNKSGDYACNKNLMKRSFLSSLAGFKTTPQSFRINLTCVNLTKR